MPWSLLWRFNDAGRGKSTLDSGWAYLWPLPDNTEQPDSDRIGGEGWGWLDIPSSGIQNILQWSFQKWLWEEQTYLG